MEPLNVKEIILLLTNTGAFGIFAILFWKRLIRATDIFTEKITQVDKQHREEIAVLVNRYHEMTERTLETLIMIKKSHEKD